MFNPGDEVVSLQKWEQYGIKKGGHYTIAVFVPALCVVPGTRFLAETDVVQLSEIGEAQEGIYWGFDARHFRKVQKRSTETGMAILRSLLDGNPVKQLEPLQSE